MFIALRRPWVVTLLSRLCLIVGTCYVTFGGPTAPAQEASSAENTLTNISVNTAGDDTVVVIQTTRRPDSSVFTLSSPARLVVDIADTNPGKLTATIPVNKGVVKEVVAKEFRDGDGLITRVTVYLTSVVEPSTTVGDTSIQIRLRKSTSGIAGASGSSDSDDLIGKELEKMGSGGTAERVEEVSMSGSGNVRSEPSSAASRTSPVLDDGAVNEISGLYFQPYEKRSRVFIKATRKLRFTASPVSSDLQVVVDVSNSTISKTYQRPLDTSEFPSAVKGISAYPLKSKANTVRIVIKLREKVDYKVEDLGDQVYLDFPVPASVAAKLPTNPVGSPQKSASTSSGGTSAVGGVPDKMRLISSSGQIMDSSDIKAPEGLGSDSFIGVGSGDGSGGLIYTGRKISIDVREADIHNVFRMIANVSKLNIVTGDNVNGRVTVRLQNVPWDQALAVILQSKGLGAVRIGNIIRIAPLEILKVERQQQLEAVKATQNLEPLQTLILPLNFAQANEVRPQVEAALSDRGKITLDTRTNALIIEDTSAGLSKAKQIAISLDTQTPQVLIEARIVEVSTSYVKELGIQWGGDGGLAPQYGNATGLFFPNSISIGGGSSVTGQSVLANSGEPNYVVDLPTASAGTLALGLGSITGGVRIDARLTAIEAIGEGKVVSAPKVMTVDNKRATISQGTRIPYESVSATGTSVQFVEATLRLEVTPHITTDGRVFLKVRVTNNRPDFGNQVGGRPAIEIKEAETEVMVKDGDTAVLGGVYTLNETDNTTGLPGIHKIPFLGWLAKSNAKRSDRKELLVFITPYVVAKKGLNEG